jgi:hypothetical protein
MYYNKTCSKHASTDPANKTDLNLRYYAFGPPTAPTSFSADCSPCFLSLKRDRNIDD